MSYKNSSIASALLARTSVFLSKTGARCHQSTWHLATPDTFSLWHTAQKNVLPSALSVALRPGLPLLLLDPLPLYVAWTILYSTLWIPDSSWWILDSLLVKLVSPIPIVNGIPGSLSWIADSKAQDSRINKKTFPRFPAGNRVTLHGAIVIVQ